MKELLRDTEDFINQVISSKYLDKGEKSFDDIVKRFEKELRKHDFMYTTPFIYYFSRKQIIPAGSVLANFGTNKRSSFSNCYVIPIKEDSIEAIFDALKEASRTFSWRGGVGFDITILRPKGSKVDNSAKYSSGAVSFMPLISTMVNTIGQEGRRGACIITIDIRHPDVIDFIKCKSNPEEVFEKDFLNDYIPNVHYANISVRITDEFMQAVIQDKDWELVFPDIEADKNFYNENWNGNYEDWVAKGGKLKVYKKIKAKELFNLIAENAWKRAEPGVLFWDIAIKNSPQNALPETSVLTVNPCGEQQLAPYGACSLYHLALHKFVKHPYTEKAEFDFDEFRNAIRVLMEFADFISDVNTHPLKQQQDFEKLARKIGIGVTGLADTFAMLNMDYDSLEARKFAEKLFKFFAKTQFEKEIEMAKEKGACPILQNKDNLKKYLEYPALKIFKDLVSDEYLKDLEKYGVRNISWSTIAPTGSVSIVADNCTSGIEPIFEIKYYRNSRLLNKTVELLHAPLLKYLIDNNPEDIKLPAEILKKKYHYKSASEIDFTSRVILQGIIQKYITDSISSTINLPNNISIDTVKSLYLEGYKTGLKGVTVYRDGCMTGVLNTEKKEAKEETPQKLPIPDIREAVTYTMYWKKNKVYITVPKVDEIPREVFVNLPPEASYDTNGKKSLPLKLEREATWEAITRLASLSLRHRVPVKEVIKQLDKASNTIGDLPNLVSRALSKSYIEKQSKFEKCPQCGKNTYVKEGGCFICKSCGFSKCD